MTASSCQLETAIAEADEAIAKLQKLRREARLELVALANEPDVGLITFEVQHDRDGKLYEYAARKAANGRWFTTGSTCPTTGYTWPKLVQFIKSGIGKAGFIEHHLHGWSTRQL